LLSWSVLGADRPSTETSRLCRTTGIAWFPGRPLRQATLNRPTWLDVVTNGEPIVAARTGDIYFLRPANQAFASLPASPSSPPVSYDFLGTKPIRWTSRAFWRGMLSDRRASVRYNYTRPPANVRGGKHGLNQIPLLSFARGVLCRTRNGSLSSQRSAGSRPTATSFSAHSRRPPSVALSPTYSYTERNPHRLLYIVADDRHHPIRPRRARSLSSSVPAPYTTEPTLAPPEVPASLTRRVAGALQRTALAGTGRHRTTANPRCVQSGNRHFRRFPSSRPSAPSSAPGVAGSNDGPSLQAHLNITRHPQST